MPLPGIIPYEVPTAVGHNVYVPPTLIPLFHGAEILMETFTLLVAHGTQIFGESVEMCMEVVHVDAHPAPQVSECFGHVFDQALCSSDRSDSLGSSVRPQGVRPLVPASKIILPPLLIKLGLMKQFVNAVEKNSTGSSGVPRGGQWGSRAPGADLRGRHFPNLQPKKQHEKQFSRLDIAGKTVREAPFSRPTPGKQLQAAQFTRFPSLKGAFSSSAPGAERARYATDRERRMFRLHDAKTDRRDHRKA